MCISVPQIDVASIRTRMSRRPGLGVGHCSKTAPGPGDGFTTACIFSFNRFPRNCAVADQIRSVKRLGTSSNLVVPLVSMWACEHDFPTDLLPSVSADKTAWQDPA